MNNILKQEIISEYNSIQIIVDNIARCFKNDISNLIKQLFFVLIKNEKSESRDSLNWLKTEHEEYASIFEYNTIVKLKECRSAMSCVDKGLESGTVYSYGWRYILT